MRWTPMVGQQLGSTSRTLSHVVAVVSVLQCLSAASCCYAEGTTECDNARKAYCFDASFSSCGRVAWNCIFNSYARCVGDGQNSTEYGCDRPCCCGNRPHTCNGVQSGIACNCRKKPTGPARQGHSGTSVGQDYPPTSRILGFTRWAPSITSTAARCSLLCRFLF